jgi:molecular chaperone GrpE
MQEETVQPPYENSSNSAEKPLEQQLAEAVARIEEMKAQHKEATLRALADSENARKRFQAEAANSQKFAIERFAESILPVMDSLEAALANKDASPEALREGVNLTLRQLNQALEKARISTIAPATGERFDPHRHQAMAAVPSHSEPNTIVATMQKGYALHDRILRPALVTVAKAVEKQDGTPTSTTDSD